MALLTRFKNAFLCKKRLVVPFFGIFALNSVALADCNTALKLEEVDTRGKRPFRLIQESSPVTKVSFTFVHGFAVVPGVMFPIAKGLSQRSNSVGVLLSGHGKSDKSLISGNPDLWRKDVLKGIARARRHGEKVVAVGYSLGGAVLADLLLRNPKLVDAAVFIAPAFASNGRAGKIARAKLAAQEFWVSDKQSDNPFANRRIPSQGLAQASFFSEGVRDRMIDAEALGILEQFPPTLMFAGKNDLLIDHQLILRLGAKTPGPESILEADHTSIVMPDATGMAFMIEKISSFLTESRLY